MQGEHHDFAVREGGLDPAEEKSCNATVSVRVRMSRSRDVRRDSGTRRDLVDSSLQERNAVDGLDSRDLEHLRGLDGVEATDVLLSGLDVAKLDGPESDLGDLDTGPIRVTECNVVVRLEEGLRIGDE